MFQALEQAMREGTSLVSIMSVNNEIGVKQPMKEIGEFGLHCALYWITM